MTELEQNKLYTAKEVAEVLRVSLGWVYAHARGQHKPKLDCVRFGIGPKVPVRFRLDQVQSFIEECRNIQDRKIKRIV